MSSANNTQVSFFFFDQTHDTAKDSFSTQNQNLTKMLIFQLKMILNFWFTSTTLRNIENEQK